jgi:monoamine oxidase
MLTKRQLLQYVGSVAGAAGVYRTMATLGMLGVSSLTGCSSESAVSQSMGDGKRVVILGAGIAGLVAAYELDDMGYDCTILEATARAGGRNLTVRRGNVLEEMNNPQQEVMFDDDDNLYANMGPARIPYHHERILGYCKKFGVSLEVFVNDNRGAFFQSPGVFGDDAVPAREIHAAQRGYIAELLAKAVNRNALDDELTMEDKDNLLTMLEDFGKIKRADPTYTGSDRAGNQGRYVNKALGGEEALPVAPRDRGDILKLGPSIDPALGWNFLHWGHDLDQQATLFQPIGGMDKIVEAFKDRVGHLIRYESAVREISNKPEGGVRVAFDNGGMMDSIEADYAVCTIPASVLKDIPNNFSQETQDAIAGTLYDKAVKIAFQGKYRFWEVEDLIYGGISWTTTNDATQIWYPSNGYHRDKGIILGAYILGVRMLEQATAERFAAMSPSQRLAAAIVAGERIHPGYGNKVEHGVSRAWSEVRYQKGSWPDFFSAPLHDLRASDGTVSDGAVYFAGDHTSDLSGWQEGAALAARATVEAIQMRAANGA